MNLPWSLRLASLATLAACGTAMGRGDILALDFEDGNTSGWTANGVPTLFEVGGNPGQYMGVPYLDFWGVSLSAREEQSQVFGDLNRYAASLRISVDVRVIALDNFNGEPVDPTNYPLALQIWNESIAADEPVSVWVLGPTLPAIADGWTRVTFDIPAPEQFALPTGWAGTGASNPDTFESMLPEGVGYRDVLSNVSRLDITTLIPGFFYGANFWEVGWDNLRVERVGSACRADFDGDGFVDFFDFNAFAECFDEIACPPGRNADFTNDGFVDFFDFDAFVSAFEEGC